MADPPSMPAQEPDRRRAAPPAFTAPIRTFSSTRAPATPTPPPTFRQFSGSQTGSSEDARGSAVVVAESDSSASPAGTQESSNQVYSNGSTKARSAVDQQSDAQPTFGLSNGMGSVVIPGGPPGMEWSGGPPGPPPSIPMGAPPSSTSHPPQIVCPPPQFSGRSGPPFASPIRPIPSFPAAAASPVTFSKIPLAAVTPLPYQEMGMDIQPIQINHRMIPLCGRV